MLVVRQVGVALQKLALVCHRAVPQLKVMQQGHAIKPVVVSTSVNK